MSEYQENTAQTIYDISKELLSPQTITLNNGAQVVAVPEGISVQSTKSFGDEYLQQPERRKGTATLTALDSFVAHVNRFKDDDSVIYACDKREKPSLTAVLDYHRSGATSDPRFGEHRSFYGMPLSDEWKAWKDHNAQAFDQREFAAFLEDRIVDVVAVYQDDDLSERVRQFKELIKGNFASPTKLTELSKGLSITSDEKVTNTYNLHSGEAQISYSSDHRDESGQALSVPNLFMIAIPVFLHGAYYKIAVRLRYRLKSGNIIWFYEMHQTDLVFDDAFSDVCTTAAEQTALPLFMGEPE